MSTTPPQITCLQNVKLGVNAEARLTAELVRTYDTVQDGLAALGDACFASEWTVYRWLRGTCTPRDRVITRLTALAKTRGVTVPQHPAPQQPDLTARK
jgi:hypothetical protein